MYNVIYLFVLRFINLLQYLLQKALIKIYEEVKFKIFAQNTWNGTICVMLLTFC